MVIIGVPEAGDTQQRFHNLARPAFFIVQKAEQQALGLGRVQVDDLVFQRIGQARDVAGSRATINVGPISGAWI